MASGIVSHAGKRCTVYSLTSKKQSPTTNFQTMTSHLDRLLALARRNAATYGANPNVAAVLLVGSVARGNPDQWSDIDCTVLCHAMLTPQEREELMLANGGSNRFTLGDESGGMDQYVVEGVVCQFGIATIQQTEEIINSVVVLNNTDPDNHCIMGGLREALPLHGNHIVERLRSAAAEYPPQLALAMVKAHLNFRPISFFQHRLAGRDDIFLLHEMLTAACRNIMGVLAGLNRMYPEHNYKRADRFISRMEVAPPDLAERLRRILGTEAFGPFTTLGQVIEELFQIVRQQMPQVDVVPAYERFTEAVGGHQPSGQDESGSDEKG